MSKSNPFGNIDSANAKENLLDSGNGTKQPKRPSIPTSDQSWLVALAKVRQDLNVEGDQKGQGEDHEGAWRYQDGRYDKHLDTVDDVVDGDERHSVGYGNAYGEVNARHRDDEGTDQDGDAVQSDDPWVSILLGSQAKTSGKRREVDGGGIEEKQAESDMSANKGIQQDEPTASMNREIARLKLLVSQYQEENVKLQDNNKRLKDDMKALMSVERDAEGDGTLSKMDREMRERMFQDMHKLVQKVSTLEGKNSVLEAANLKLREMLDKKESTAVDEPPAIVGRDLLLPSQDTINSQDIVKMVEDLNVKMTKLAKDIQREITSSLNLPQRGKLDLLHDEASSIIGTTFAGFLKKHAMSKNPPKIVIRAALQAVLARLCQIGIVNWCPHNRTSSKTFTEVYDDIVKTVNRTVAENWRRITHSHIPLDKGQWKTRVTSNLKCIIDLIYFPYLTPTEHKLSNYISPLLDPLFYSVYTLRSAFTTGLVTKTLFISFPEAGSSLATTWMDTFPIADESSPAFDTESKSRNLVMTSITLGVDRLTQTNGLKFLLKPKVVVEQAPPTITVSSTSSRPPRHRTNDTDRRSRTVELWALHSLGAPSPAGQPLQRLPRGRDDPPSPAGQPLQRLSRGRDDAPPPLPYRRISTAGAQMQSTVPRRPL